MESKVLIAYATTHGSTQEIAETVAAVLREGGQNVDLQPARQARSLAGYSAVVLGAPLYMFRLHKDATRFLARHRQALSGGLPVAVFAGGPFGEPKPAELLEIHKSVERELAKFPWLTPAAVEIMGGKFDPDRLRFPYNLIPALKQMPASDLRDWDAIRAWAKSLPVLFQPA